MYPFNRENKLIFESQNHATRHATPEIFDYGIGILFETTQAVHNKTEKIRLVQKIS